MDRSKCFTRDLYLCYEQFAQFYTERSGQMYRALVNCFSGQDSLDQYAELVTFLSNEGRRCLDS